MPKHPILIERTMEICAENTGDDGPDVGGEVWRHSPLDRGQIARAHQRETTILEGLLREPIEGIASVTPLIDQWIPFSLRFPLPTNVLGDTTESVSHEAATEDVVEHRRQSIVGIANQHGGPGPLALGQEDLGAQSDAVAHGHSLAMMRPRIVAECGQPLPDPHDLETREEGRKGYDTQQRECQGDAAQPAEESESAGGWAGQRIDLLGRQGLELRYRSGGAALQSRIHESSSPIETYAHPPRRAPGPVGDPSVSSRPILAFKPCQLAGANSK